MCPPTQMEMGFNVANNINLHLALDLMHYKHPTVHLKRPKKTKLIYTTYNKYTIAFKVNTAKRASCLGGGSRSLSVIVVLYSLSVLFTSSVFFKDVLATISSPM